jgi:hypothetical protein
MVDDAKYSYHTSAVVQRIFTAGGNNKLFFFLALEFLPRTVSGSRDRGDNGSQTSHGANGVNGCGVEIRDLRNFRYSLTSPTTT